MVEFVDRQHTKKEDHHDNPTTSEETRCKRLAIEKNLHSNDRNSRSGSSHFGPRPTRPEHVAVD